MIMVNDNSAVQDPQIQEMTPGKLLAEKRKTLGLSELEVADGLKMSVSRLKLIEVDDFSLFPSETYIKGHLKNYCRLIKCDEQEVMRLYQIMHENLLAEEFVESTEDLVLPNVFQKYWRSIGIVLLVLLVLLVLCGMFYWLFGVTDQPEQSLVLDQTKEQAATQAATEESALPLPVDVVDQSPIATDPLSTLEEEGDSSLVVSKLTAAELAQTFEGFVPQAENAANGDAQQPLIVAGGTLKFYFANESWVQVVDATNAVLFKGLNTAGSELILNGSAPFDIVIGNVDGTVLVYNDEPVDLVAPKDKKVLRLILKDPAR
jgi:cytoskeleton protein RodZ